ncbi:MAG: PQQ-binding-like beta-propeller repeat protein [Pirellulales bacterium]|nr:PQQ-binding-like beta-propeller repeat protein [Pirellulales bacterium]
MFSAEDFLTLLEEKDLLSPETLAKLRRQIAQSGKRIPAAKVAKLLVEKGHLTPAQAKRLLDAGKPPAEKPTPAAPPAAKPPAAPKRAAEDDLGLAPIDEETEWGPGRRKKSSRPTPATPSPPPVPQDPPPIAPAPLPPREEESLLELKAVPEQAPAPGVKESWDQAMAGAGDAAAGSPLDAPQAPRGLLSFFRRKRNIKKKDDWGSSLMLVGGGALMVLVLMIVVLIWWLNRGRGEEMLEQATDDYRAGSYRQAINKYDQYLKEYPNHNGASLARVRRGLAQMRQATQSGSDWSEALKTVNRVLPEIRKEDDFKEAYGELAGMLPEVAKGLAAKAREAADPGLVEQTRKALSYLTNTKYVPKNMTPTGKIQDIEASLALTVRQIQKNKDHKEVVAAIQKAVADNKPAEAYAQRKKLLKQYPDLIDDPELTKAAAMITAAQQGEVRFVEEPRSAETQAPAASFREAAVLLSRQTTAPVPGAEDVVWTVAVEHAAFGLDAATGKVRWRLALGAGDGVRAGIAPPLALDSAGKDVVLVDQAHQALLRIASATGAVQWRFPVGEAFTATPVLAAGRILQATESGKLWIIDPARGDSPGYFQLPQPLRVAPAVDAVRGLVFQPADSANLYVLRLEDRSCLAVYLLAHEEGSCRVPPVVIGGFVVVGFNEGARDSTLRLMTVVEEKGKKTAVKTLQQLHLKGRLDTPPAADDNRLLTVTDLGLIKVFELARTQKTTQLREVADTPLPDGESLMRFPLLQNGQFWIAGRQLARYDVLGTKGQLVPKWITESGSAFLQPPKIVGPALIAVRRLQQLPGVYATAAGKEEPNPYWQTQLAASLVELLVDGSGGKFLAVTATGGLYRLDSDALRGETALAEPLVQIALAQLPGSVARVAPLDGDRLALRFGPDEKQLVIFDARETPARIYRHPLPAPLSGPPSAFSEGVLAPLASGQVVLLDPLSGEPKLEPFQPALSGSSAVRWRQGVACGPKQFVIADDQSHLYLVGVSGQPAPHLTLLRQVGLSNPAAAAPVVVEKTVFVACARQTLEAFTLPELSPVQGDEHQRKLTASCVWGPYALGDRILLATEDGRLACWDATAKSLWQVKFEHGPPVGTPLADGGRVILAAKNGALAALDAGSGKETSCVDLGRPLATGPVASGSQWLVGGADGCVYAVEKK